MKTYNDFIKGPTGVWDIKRRVDAAVKRYKLIQVRSKVHTNIITFTFTGVQETDRKFIEDLAKEIKDKYSLLDQEVDFNRVTDTAQIVAVVG